MKPLSATDEGGQVAPATFRNALAAILPGLPTTVQAAAPAVRVTTSVVKHRKLSRKA